MEEGSSGDLMISFTCCTKDSLLSNVWGGRQSGIVNGEAEVLGSFGVLS